MKHYNCDPKLTGTANNSGSTELERWDVVRRNGTRIGRRVVRAGDLRPGQFHLVVHVWIRNEANVYLVQRRADGLDRNPGIWATTAGSVLAGEDSLSAAIRETNEELGLVLDQSQLRRIARLTSENRVEDIWLAEVVSAVMGLPKPGAEVSDFMWATKSEICRMIKLGEFFPYSYFDQISG